MSGLRRRLVWGASTLGKNSLIGGPALLGGGSVSGRLGARGLGVSLFSDMDSAGTLLGRGTLLNRGRKAIVVTLSRASNHKECGHGFCSSFNKVCLDVLLGPSLGATSAALLATTSTITIDGTVRSLSSGGARVG